MTLLGQISIIWFEDARALNQMSACDVWISYSRALHRPWLGMGRTVNLLLRIYIFETDHDSFSLFDPLPSLKRVRTDKKLDGRQNIHFAEH